LPGPFASLVLADLGAQVDKVEDGGAGDYLRHLLPGPGGGPSTAFQALNRGKRSAVLDLKSELGRQAFRQVLGRYDVLLEQFRPGVMDRLGLGHQGLLDEHPRLIVCALTGFGQTGPWASRAGHDLNYLARAGTLSFQGPAEGPPQVLAVQLADVSSGLWSVIAILAALRERDRTGRGRIIDVSMVESVLGFATPSLAAALNGQPVARGEEPLSGGLAVYRAYLSSDGELVTLAALEPKFWLAFCAAVGLEADMSALIPGPHQAELAARLEQLFASKTAAEWAQIGEAADCCLAVAVRPDELATDPLLDGRGAWVEVRTPEGQVRCFRTPVSGAAPPATPAPRAGEHTRAILADAGLGAEEIDELLSAGAARQAE
jgi:crotonobetainyl-CoA:carnitine CoA-transferase CaiB-like acyl-CoA transferase